MQAPAKPLLALPSWELSHRTPRGIERVARAFAEELVAMDAFELVCITQHIKNARRPLFVCEPLSSWLASHSLESPPVGLAGALKYAIWMCLPRVLVPVAREAGLTAMRIADGLRRRLRRRRAAHAAATFDTGLPQNEEIIVGLDDLDYLLLVDPGSILFESDLASSDCVVASFMHDTIPLRIDEGEHWVPQLFAAWVRRLAQCSRVVLCESNATRSDALAFFGDDVARKCQLVPLGHDRGRFATPCDASAPRALLRRLGLDPASPYFAFLGQVEDRKNVKNILRAAEIVACRVPELKFALCIVGYPQSISRYQALLSRVRRKVPVAVTGYMPGNQVPGIVQNSVGLLFPSLWEGFGLPILEAMSARTRVITSDISSMPEVAGSHAVYCDPYDPQSIADAMLCVLREPPEVRQRHLDAAFEYAGQFTWAKATERLVAILHAQRLNGIRCE